MSDEKRGAAVDVAQVVAQLEAARRDGSLAAAVATGWPRYQASASRPGLLERIDSDGSVTVGAWRGGRFVPLGD